MSFAKAFVTKVDHDEKNGKPKTLQLHTGRNAIIARTTVESSQPKQNDEEVIPEMNESFFHVIERHGFEDVLKTVTGDDDNGTDVAKKAFQTLELFERLGGM